MIFFLNSMSSRVTEKIFLAKIRVVPGAGTTVVEKTWALTF